MTHANRPIRVLIVDDSAVSRDYLRYIFESAGSFEVVGTAGNGKEAIERCAALRPDVITMDLRMPVMDGLEATRRIMEAHPTPVVVVSATLSPDEVGGSFAALQAGAVTTVMKPRALNHPDAEHDHRQLLDTVRLMAEVRVVRRRARRDSGAPPGPTPQVEAPARERGGPVELVAIGASTGGPPVLSRILGRLPADFAAPVVVVQHITPGFLDGMVSWLSEVTPLRVSVGSEGELLEPGRVYFGPDGHHVGVTARGTLRLSSAPPEYGVRPAAAHLFRSAAAAYGARSVGVILTGMGRDGAQELRAIQDRGGVTIAQDQDSSVVWGMPGEAVRLGVTDHILDPEAIAARLCALVRQGRA